MKRQVYIEVEVDDDLSSADVVDSVKRAILATDGEQHLELMNWEPPRMTVLRARDVTPIPNEDNDRIDRNNGIGILVEDTRQVIVRFNMPKDADVDAFFGECCEKLKARYAEDDEIFGAATPVFIQLNDEDGSGDWDEFWPKRPSLDIPEINGDWMLREV